MTEKLLTGTLSLNTNKLSQIGTFFVKIGKKCILLAFGTGPFMGPGYIGRNIPEIDS